MPRERTYIMVRVQTHSVGRVIIIQELEFGSTPNLGGCFVVLFSRVA